MSGKLIPMESVAWDTMCDPRTVVTDDDPLVDFPQDIKIKSRENFIRIAELLRVLKGATERLKTELLVYERL